MDNVTRSGRYRMMVTIDDKEVKLIHKITKSEFYPIYINPFGKMYYFDDNEIVFIKEEKYKDYEVVEE